MDFLWETPEEWREHLHEYFKRVIWKNKGSPVNTVTMPLKTLGFFFFSFFLFLFDWWYFLLRHILPSVHSGCKLFAFSVLGLRGILTACANFPLKCKLLTSQSFHLFYLLMWDPNKYVEHLKFSLFLCFLGDKSHAYCTVHCLMDNVHNGKIKLIWGWILYVSWRFSCISKTY